MRYIYKHGNLYWYQRSIPEKFFNILKKKTIKISLKTNKISTALKRAKLQALEHKKMFINLQKNNFKVKFFGKIDVDSYNLNFKEDIEDLTSSVLLNKRDIKTILVEKDYQSLENLIFNNLKKPKLSELIEKYLKIKNFNNKSRQYSSIINSLKYLINICGNKPIEEYSHNDCILYREFFIDKKRISTGKRYQSNLFNFFQIIHNFLGIEKKNPFQAISWPSTKINYENKVFVDTEFTKILDFVDNNDSILSIMIGLMINTGLSVSEIVGLNDDEINLNQFNPYIIIRSNKIRMIKNIYKRRVIPLVGCSFDSVKKLNIISNEEFPFLKRLYSDKDTKNIENKINFKLKKLTENKTIQSIKLTLIDRLKRINCPEEVISEIIGLKKRNIFYQNEITIELKQSWLSQII